MVHFADEINILNIDRFNSQINELFYEYYDKYGERPKFIKVPIWVLILLREQCHKILGYSPKMEENDYDTYMGLKICPTKSIETIEEVEVF